MLVERVLPAAECTMDIHPAGFLIELPETHSKEEPEEIWYGYISDAGGNVRSLIIC